MPCGRQRCGYTADLLDDCLYVVARERVSQHKGYALSVCIRKPHHMLYDLLAGACVVKSSSD